MLVVDYSFDVVWLCWWCGWVILLLFVGVVGYLLWVLLDVIVYGDGIGLNFYGVVVCFWVVFCLC